jgi:membrane protein YqaA with SNARE-associated domain
MLARLTALLVSYGPMGILVLSFIDSAGIPMASGMDALVILVAIKAPSRAYFAASMGVLGSVIGNLALFMAARTGVRWFVRDVPHPGPRRFHEWFERYGLLTVFVPAAMPIPLPLKIFVISAAVARTPLRSFMAAIAVGRFIRYFGEAYLGVALGRDSLPFLRAHTWPLIAGAVALFAALYAAVMLNERRKRGSR